MQTLTITDLRLAPDFLPSHWHWLKEGRYTTRSPDVLSATLSVSSKLAIDLPTFDWAAPRAVLTRPQRGVTAPCIRGEWILSISAVK